MRLVFRLASNALSNTVELQLCRCLKLIGVISWENSVWLLNVR